MNAEEFHDFQDDDDEDLIACDGMSDHELHALDLCGQMPDGQCGQAGSEYCDFECPYRDG